jgi:glyoxylase-like metal-dependent hydrolase (beta-lactamase superfamily II)
VEWKAQTTELAHGVFAYVQDGGGFCVANAGLIASDAGVIAVDALFAPSMTNALLDANQRLTARPITHLLNTHHHVDHTLGNALFPSDTKIIAHERARAEMERVGLGVLPLITRIAPHFESEVKGVRERLPDFTFEGASYDLEVAGPIVRLLYYGTAHTRGDVLVHLPRERILFTGDLGFFGVTPLAIEGHIGRWIKVGQSVIEEIDAEVLVPGHGPPGTKADLQEMLDYLILVHEGARRGFESGASAEETVRSIELGKYAGWVDPERLAVNVARCFQEFRGEITE